MTSLKIDKKWEKTIRVACTEIMNHRKQDNKLRNGKNKTGRRESLPLTRKPHASDPGDKGEAERPQPYAPSAESGCKTPSSSECSAEKKEEKNFETKETIFF